MAIQYENDQKHDDGNNVNIDVPSNPEVRKGISWLHFYSPQYVCLMVMLAVTILMSIITLAVLLTRHQPNSTPHISIINETGRAEKYFSVSDTNETFLPLGDVKIVSRKEWLANPPVEEATPLELPVPYVIISHTGTENCTDIATCIFHVRTLQSFHMDSKGWWDIAYNFLVGGDGYAYEGRGWKSQGAHSYGYNSKSIGITLIGTFNQMLPPKRQIVAVKQLIQMGIEKGYIAPNYKLLGSRQVQTTQSPGLLLYEDIKKWPHWTANP